MPHDAAAKKAAPSKHGNEALGHVGHSSIRRNDTVKPEPRALVWGTAPPARTRGRSPIGKLASRGDVPLTRHPGDALSKMGHAMRYAIESTDVFVDASRAGGLFGGGRADPHSRRR